MESVGAFRIFERSVMKRELQYTEYYGDGDSKAFLKVKDIYGEDTVTKLECIGHVQKRVGSRLRKFFKKPKDSVEKDTVHSLSSFTASIYRIVTLVPAEKSAIPSTMRHLANGLSLGVLLHWKVCGTKEFLRLRSEEKE
ncbi:hypothetical protein AVEN_184621-1 [Araneus ventricosus]|uniref:Mutator-like transposase domain-containing protein n=1 Tax=Araneus ventricosus TaxID=182803 RepID=A0A4Y2EA84_ARAVE|nr:hypothetical protein AVEN_184621-1 [Araneus ventricosus]